MSELKPKLLANPERCPGSYSLHMYCKYENPAHGWDEFPWEIGAGLHTRAEAVREARAFGWILHHDNTATCPKCAKALNTRTKGQDSE